MEAIGTPMGGGALKLEATHLKRLPVPLLDSENIARLNEVDDHYPAEQIDTVMLGALMGNREDGRIRRLAEQLQTFIDDAQSARQRK